MANKRLWKISLKVLRGWLNNAIIYPMAKAKKKPKKNGRPTTYKKGYINKVDKYLAENQDLVDIVYKNGKVPDNAPEGLFISPADGCVSAVNTVEHHEVTDGPAVVIRVFLSVLNVHVNRSPSKLTVLKVDYSPGEFHDARSEKCPIENESNLITLRTTSGETIGVRQIAGKVARRIVCKVSPGDTLELGQRFGMIKFGSSAELILPRPDDVIVHVNVGQRVKGGLTQLATLKPLSQENS